MSERAKIGSIICALSLMMFGSSHSLIAQQPQLKTELELFKNGKYDDAIKKLQNRIDNLEAANQINNLYIESTFLLASCYMHSYNNQKAVNLFRSGVELADAMGLDSLAVSGSSSLAVIYRFIGHIDSLELYSRKILTYDTAPLWAVSNANNLLGSALNGSDHVDSVIYYYKKAIDIDRSINDSSSMPYSCLDLATYYGDIDSQELALQYIIEGRSYLRDGIDDFKKAIIVDRLVEIYIDLGNFVKAENYLNEQKELLQKKQSQKNNVEHLFNQYELAVYKGNIDLAIEHLNTALKISEKIGFKWGVLKSKLNLLYVQMKNNKPINMNEYEQIISFRDSIVNPRVARSIELLEFGVESKKYSPGKFENRYQELSNKYDVSQHLSTYLTLLRIKQNYLIDRNQYQEAIDVIASIDSIKSARKILNDSYLISHMESEFQSEQKENEIALLNEKNKNSELKLQTQRNRLWAGTFGLGLFSLLSFFLYRKNKTIDQQKKEISKALSEKDILLREIHHRVKNNLQMVSSLLTMQGRSIDDNLAQQAINEGKNRVLSMALIHQDLYNQKNLTGINVKSYLEKLTTELFNTYKVDDLTIKLDLDIDDIHLDVDTLVPLGLIINELITNSLKYAFVDRDKGLLSVHLHTVDNLLRLVVSDNGIGYKPLSRKASFGSVLIKALTEQLSGTIDIQSDNGTKVTIDIADYKITD